MNNKEESPLVTILMPVRNAHPVFFREAVSSVLQQTNPEWRLIIIHDADDPGDHTLKLLEELRRQGDDRVSIEQNETQKLTGALNTGMKKARTSYVCNLLSDDMLAPQAIEILNGAIITDPEIDFFYSSRRIIDEKGNPEGAVSLAREFSVSDFIDFGPVKHLHCWKVASALQTGGMDESLGPHGADDYDFPWCMAEAGFSFKTIPECLYYYRNHREYRLTTHVPLDVQAQEIRKILRKHGVSEEEIEWQIQKRKKGYLRQALYRTALEPAEKNSWVSRIWKAVKE